MDDFANLSEDECKETNKNKHGANADIGSDEHKGKDAGGKRGESTKKVVDEILGFDAGLWNELSDLSSLHRR